MFSRQKKSISVQSNMKSLPVTLTVSLLALVLTGCASTSSPSNSASNFTANAGAAGSANTSSSNNLQSAASRWMNVDTSAHTVTLTLYGALNGRLNFNGYANGYMTVTVPVNWHVHIHFENKGQLANSVMIAPLAAINQKNPPQPAFTGAAVKNAEKGLPHAGKASFSFVANKAGKYVIMSGIPGYGASGMWDHFNVASAAKPSLTVKNQ